MQQDAKDRQVAGLSPERAALHRLEQAVARLEPKGDPKAVLAAIKATLHKPIPPNGLTILQQLGARHREQVFNAVAAEEHTDVHSDFCDAINEFAANRGDTTPKRTRQLVKNVWRSDHAANRRALAGHRSPYRGKPEVYDPHAVTGIADAIARAVGLPEFKWYHGDTSIADSSNGGPMQDVLTRAVEWAMVAAWSVDAAPGTNPPQAKAEGVLSALRRQRRRTD